MRKTNIFLIIALTLVALAGVALYQVSTVSAQGNGPVGVVVAYEPGQSITIVDQSGTQIEYMISPSLRILPAGRANMLEVGSFVTIIAPASIDQGRQTAVGIVVHPQVPPGWNVPTGSATPIATSTPIGPETATPTGTLATEPPPATFTETATPLGTGTPTETSTPTPFGMDTPTPTPAGGGVTVPPNTFIEWLRSIVRELVSGQ